ncbi:hypothetical protein FCL87_02845 [Mycoplasma bovis]|uniref:MHO_1580 family protein n=1 Tax=Mycoplasmopsis bovis TaxID=28903 RepID=UPI001BDE97F9|nr:hypothetical protein [Mycoplasmopsis bovis]MBT1328984.1 hypothetical protein [Mycoplasmopsis bovis]UJB28002.1 hypothetical protein FG866_00145 [Mycoplasmopsis bovis]
MFTIILPGSIISDLNNNTVNQSNVAIIDNREFVTKATGIHYVDWSDDYKAFRFFESSLKAHKNMVKRGAIEIRRIFNSDKFVLRYWRVSPTSIDGDEDLSFTLAINNKVVEQTSDNRQNVKYTNKELEKNLGRYDSLMDTNYFVTRTGDGCAMLQVMTLTSDYLGLSFEDLENIVVTFPMDSWRTAHGHNYDFWEVKFDKLQNKNKTINAVNNHAVIKIPEYYRFSFDEFGRTNEEVKYFNVDVNINPFSQDSKSIKLAEIKSESSKHKEEGFFIKEWKGNPEFKEKAPNQDSFDGVKKIWEANRHFFKNQSLNDLRIDSIFNSALDINNFSVDTVTTSSVYNKGTDIKQVNINDYYEFDYKKGQLVNSVSGTNKGLFIPFNFKGNFNTSYRFIWKTKDKGKNSIHTVQINNSQKVTRPMLDPYSGLVKLKVSDEVADSQRTYSFRFLSSQIKEIIELKENPSTEMFERFRNE